MTLVLHLINFDPRSRLFVSSIVAYPLLGGARGRTAGRSYGLLRAIWRATQTSARTAGQRPASLDTGNDPWRWVRAFEFEH